MKAQRKDSCEKENSQFVTGKLRINCARMRGCAEM